MVGIKEVGTWAISSVGRAIRLHRKGHRFESCIAHKIKERNTAVFCDYYFVVAMRTRKAEGAKPPAKRAKPEMGSRKFAKQIIRDRVLYRPPSQGEKRVPDPLPFWKGKLLPLIYEGYSLPAASESPDEHGQQMPMH